MTSTFLDTLSGPQPVRPDAILTGTGPEVKPSDALNPCPFCGHFQHQAPEGVDNTGAPQWQNEHCFKCGFRPGTNVAVDQARMQQAFQAFQKYVADNNLFNHPSLQPPADQTEADALRAQLAEVQAKLAAQEPAQQPQGQ